MYLLIDCQDSTGTYKSSEIARLQDHADLYLEMDDLIWMDEYLRIDEVRMSPCGRYELHHTYGKKNPLAISV